MKLRTLVFFITLFGFACTQKPKVPNVSHIAISLTTQRFEENFFAIDTNNIQPTLQQLNTQYQGFAQDFVFNILGIPQNPTAINSNVKAFIGSYYGIYTDAKKMYTPTKLKAIEQQVQQALQYTKYYFPNYKAPTGIITFVGPLNSYANIVTTNNKLAIGLQLYMGSNYAAYQTEQSLQLYPTYVSKRFAQEYIIVNCVKNIVDDIVLQQPTIKSNNLIEEIIAMGKQQYLQHALLPSIPDSLQFGYTAQQTEDCYNNEKAIYTMFVNNNLLFETDRNIIAPFITDGPNTETLGKDSPGNIGAFMGYRIVQKWMQQQKNISLTQLLQTPPQTIFNEAKYKP
jgi:hypothetical protein